MERTNIYLSTIQLAKLREKAKRTGLSVAELVRRAVDLFIDTDEGRIGNTLSKKEHS